MPEGMIRECAATGGPRYASASTRASDDATRGSTHAASTPSGCIEFAVGGVGSARLGEAREDALTHPLGRARHLVEEVAGAVRVGLRRLPQIFLVGGVRLRSPRIISAEDPV